MKQPKPILQGGLDSFCGVYAICNAFRVVKDASDHDVEMLFEDVVSYLSRKRILKSLLIEGMYHKDISNIIRDVVKNIFIETITIHKWKDYSLSDFWRFSNDYLAEPKTAMILSIGGKENHYTVVEKMTDKTMFLLDSGGIKRINKSSSVLHNGNNGRREDKYVIYPNQCWFLKG